jgi:hypothetical protein
MMKLFAVATFLTFSLVIAAQAQDCRRCTREASVAACVSCNMAAGGYTMAQSQKWCRKNQPLCGGNSAKR